MIKIVYIFIFIVITSSCEMPLICFPTDGFKTTKSVSVFLEDNIKYKKDILDYWQYPEETIKKAYGDCEDWASLKAHLILENGISDDVLLVCAWSKITKSYHMLLQVDGVYIESVQKFEYSTESSFYLNNSVIYKITLENYIQIAKIMHIFRR